MAVQNASAGDNLTFGQSGTTYTTGGGIGWIGNSMAYIYYPSEFRIGTGVGSTPVFDLLSSGRVLVGTITDNGTDKIQVAGSVTAAGLKSSAGLATNLRTVTANDTATTSDRTIILNGSSLTE